MVTAFIAGMSSSAAFAAVVWFGRVFLLPALISRLENTPQISGSWDIIATDDPHKGESVGEVQISQYGNKIKAKYRRKRRSDGTYRVFRSQGRIVAGQLILKNEEVKQAGYNVGTSVLKLSSDGREMKGLNVYYHHDQGEVVSVPALLCRRQSYA